ncbi:NUDIX domain-containing protein [Candidatus Pacearchaeota archaeon]|nr:NUDIX domain-containing protein [Candidatus Pacearchaeota archaeon]
MKNEKSSGAVVFYLEENSNEPKFLLLKYPTYWGFAKGWLEQGETEDEAARREIKEEANLDVNFIPGFKHSQKWFFKLKGELINKEAVFFLAQISEKEADKVRISEEHDDFKWLNLKEALKLIKIKSNREMLEKAYDFILEFEKQKKLF